MCLGNISDTCVGNLPLFLGKYWSLNWGKDSSITYSNYRFQNKQEIL